MKSWEKPLLIFLNINSTHAECPASPEGEPQKIYTEGSDALNDASGCFFIS